MRLKKLEIYGFKSFAERTEIVFDQGITGIVGPNGSGKSNISDAVRWVLGEQNARSLRGAKMEDIIFNGTATRKRLGYCEVSLVFDNEEKQLPIDYLEVMVTRRVYRNGDSEYYLNKNACRLKDIVELFRDTGIGKEGYSLIGQGRIDEILSVKSDDRRQVFEEAAGIVKYRARKEEAERRMENTRKNLERVEDILEELARQLEPLKGQSEDAKQYLELRERQRGLELNAFLLRSDRMQQKIAELGEGAVTVEEAIAQQQREIEQDSQRRTEDEEGLAACQRALSDAHAKVLEATSAIQAFEGEHNLRRADLRHLREEIARYDEEIEQSAERQQALQQSSQDVGGAREALTAQLTRKQEKLAEMEIGLQKAQAECDALEQEVDQKKAAIIDAMNRLSDVRSGKARLEAMRQQLQARQQEVAQQKTEQEARSAEFTGAVEQARAQSDEVGKSLEGLKTRSAEYDAQVRGEGERIENLNGQLSELLGRQHALDSRLKVLKEMQRDFEGYPHAVKQVLQHARGDARIHGVVAGILRVPADYERALEAVLGGALQHVVTQDEYAAKEMIQYLKENKRGRATFLPMNTIRGRTLAPAERQVLSMPGCLGVASELVDFEEPYRGIVESLLGRTVIATDLDAGIEIMRRGRHAFRLVTVGGDVMHSGGSMTGGSAHSRMTNLLSREREIKEHTQALAECQQNIEQARAALQKAEALRGEVKKARGEIFNQLHQEEIAVAREHERLSRAQAELDAHEAAIAQHALMLEQLRDNLADIEGQLAGIESQQGDAQQDTSSMQQEVASLSHQMAERRARVEAVREQVTAQRMMVTAEEKELESNRRDEQRTLRELETLADQIEKKTQKRTEAAERLTDMQNQLTGDVAQQDALLRGQQERQEALAAAEKQVERHQADMRARTEAGEQRRKELDALVDRQHRLQLQLQRQEGDLRQLQDRIWTDYELTYEGALEYRLEDFTLAPAERELEEIRARIREMGNVNVNAIEDYRTTFERHEDLSTQRGDLMQAREDLTGIIDGLLVKMEKQFREQFTQLGEYFSETFTRLFGGGSAELRLLDPKDALNCGIEIIAQPPGKKLQMLTLLSGGERALTAIAILFAMLRLKPTPFCILDEIEAALDDANIGYFAEFLSEFAKDTQFVVVTHRKGTMERCDALYGVAMEEKGVSRMVSVQLTDQQQTRAV